MKKLVHKSNLARGNNRNGISVASNCVANNFGENTNSRLRKLPKPPKFRANRHNLHLRTNESAYPIDVRTGLTNNICDVVKTFSIPAYRVACYPSSIKETIELYGTVIKITYNISYPIVKNTKNKSEIIQKAFGLWKDNQQDGLEYQQKLRDEWE
ncbi:MAG: hypothetical protein RLZZ210_96 [Pseudomonadota bacterium]|jgi:hypothetical protein